MPLKDQTEILRLAAWLHQALGWPPFLNSTLLGPSLLPAAIVLAIMILPTIAAVSLDALRAVPQKVKQTAHGTGVTHWEAILRVMLPTAATGIAGALVLGLGRALGETMALAMLVGNSNQISLSLFSPANTLAALLVLNFPEAGPAEVEVLMYASLVLVLVTLLVNLVGSSAFPSVEPNDAGPTRFRPTDAQPAAHVGRTRSV